MCKIILYSVHVEAQPTSILILSNQRNLGSGSPGSGKNYTDPDPPHEYLYSIFFKHYECEGGDIMGYIRGGEGIIRMIY